jgi:molybdopterin biosynthesis enzyme
MPRFGSLTPLSETLARLLALIQQIKPRSFPIRSAVGRVLAEPLRPPRNVPEHAISLRDGWAIASSATVGASSYSPVPVAGQVAWVENGQPLPGGTDAVLPPDGVSRHGGFTEIVVAVAPGEGVRRAGQDATAHMVLRADGERLRRSDVAIALAAGIEHAVVREARVRIVALLAPDARGGSEEIVTRFVEEAGAVAEPVVASGRDPVSISAALDDAGFDLCAIIGGTGLGRADHSAGALARAGSLVAHGIALRPGETAGCGVVGARPVILVPGRLEAALAATLLLVLPCLDHLTGAGPRRPTWSGRLTRKVSSSIGMTELVLLRSSEEGFEPLAVGDLTLGAVAAADAWLAVAADREGFAAGETVAAFVL